MKKNELETTSRLLLMALRKKLFLIITTIVMIIVLVIVSIDYLTFRNYNTIFVVRDNVKVEKLSDYFPKLEGSIGDASIYIIGTQNQDEPSALLLGGVHPNEPAGQMAVTLIMEQIDVLKGTIYIITESNRSAYTHSHPQEATPMYYDINSSNWDGARTFKYGSRATNAIDQWPISDVYAHSATGQKLSGTDTRNLNRSFPGNPNGNYTEQVATAIINLINENNITLTLDFHEASPEYGTNNALIFHEKVDKTGISGIMDLSFGMYRSLDPRFAPIKMERSPTNLRGLTHREIGDNTDSLPFLVESSNTTQGRIRGVVTPENIVSGEDKFYERATALGILEVNHSKSVSLHERTGRHVETFKILIDSYNMFAEFISTDPEISKYQKGNFIIDYHGMGFDTILDNGVGHFLRDPDNPNVSYWESDFS